VFWCWKYRCTHFPIKNPGVLYGPPGFPEQHHAETWRAEELISTRDFYPIEIVSAISHPCVLMLKISLHSFSHQKPRGSLWSPGVSGATSCWNVMSGGTQGWEISRSRKFRWGRNPWEISMGQKSLRIFYKCHNFIANKRWESYL
jgi:hypothetical protein